MGLHTWGIGWQWASPILGVHARRDVPWCPGAGWLACGNRMEGRDNMIQPKLIASLGLIGALAVSAAPALAAGKVGASHRPAVTQTVSGQHGRPTTKPVKGTGTHGKSLRQLEGTVVSFDGTALVM